MLPLIENQINNLESVLYLSNSPNLIDIYGGMDICVLGCGPSSSIPSLRCIVSKSECRVCDEAYHKQDSKNRRYNPSLLIRALCPETQQRKAILIDCGKTFRQSALRAFPKLKVDTIDAVLITHDHADAMLGLDDLRELQVFKRSEIDDNAKVSIDAMDVHCDHATQLGIQGKFPYLLVHDKVPKSWVSKLRLRAFQSFQTLHICGFQFTPIPVFHGDKYISHGFRFGYELNKCFVYISDVSEIPKETSEYLISISRIDILMIDALCLERYHSTHMNLKDVLEQVKILRPLRTILTGMGHDFDYETTSEMLKNDDSYKDYCIEMAYDMQTITL